MDEIMALDLKDIDERILDELAAGRNVPSNLAEELDSSRQWIQQRLGMLEAAGHVENIGRGVYELVDDPREETDATAGRDRPGKHEEQADDGRADREQLVSTLDEFEAENEQLKEDLNDCRERLERAQPVDVDRVAAGIRAALTALEGQSPDIDMATSELEGVLETIDD